MREITQQALTLARLGKTDEAADMLDKAQEIYLRAIEIDDQIPEVYSVLL